MIAWFITTKLGRIVGVAFAVALAVSGFYWFAYSSGKDSAKQAQKDKALENLRERESNDQKIDSLPSDELDSRFSRWVRPE